MWQANVVQTAFNGAGAPAARESAGTGRQARLRGVCQPTWEFKSPLSHHTRKTTRLGGFSFALRQRLKKWETAKIRGFPFSVLGRKESAGTPLRWDQYMPP